ncbi:MAG TPA: aminotransferase class V-fold PLP-dependent enzyme, partial [Catalimonadaceae bacterium]|nr:aminotransferase class V-fold PLP-dependent enzyme [Catalimonadaceae bacterium]
MDEDVQPANVAFDAALIRKQFPILGEAIGKNPLVYFDNAATTQKPLSVIEKLSDYYNRYNANIHRGAHFMANLGTAEYERSRSLIQKFLNAPTPEQIIFTKGTTEGINLIASGLTKIWLRPGDEILISTMEHHANIVPWQMACEQTGAILKVIPISDSGELDLEAAQKLITSRTRVFSIVYVSNSLGTINPIQELVKSAKEVGALTVVDAAQAVGHFSVDVQELGMDFLVFSGHKLFGPTGTGVLYGVREWLEKLPPYQGGGEMIKEGRVEKTTY